ncbi:cytoplasmic tRNA 2-thiolation protein 2 isoform X5 [Ranitomeya variabilis]|uniref:cytoplasmic tRNA 2-thiolation protein 2 isoform X5 n=1 Tax=Ranitomeya variabilis TaxID=490064 RepID=UPI00405709BC
MKVRCADRAGSRGHKVYPKSSGFYRRQPFPSILCPWSRRFLFCPQIFSLPQSVLQSVLPGNPAPAENYKLAVNSFLGQRRAHGAEELSGTADEQAELCVTGDECSNTYSRPPPETTAALADIFNSARTLTAKVELLQSLRNHLLLHVARTCGYPKVMSGESCTCLAARLLANISLGRGAFLALDTGFSDDRSGNVVIVRPMREYSLKEISFYNRLFHVPSVFIPTMETKAPENSSLQHLSECFITKLQAEFPSTVSTVYRTSEKLNISWAEAAAENVQQERCLMCMCSLDTRVGDASAFSATQISQNLSQKKPKSNAEPTGDPEKQCCSGGQSCDLSTSCSGSPRTQDFTSFLCYSCRVMMKDVVGDISGAIGQKKWHKISTGKAVAPPFTGSAQTSPLIINGRHVRLSTINLSI